MEYKVTLQTAKGQGQKTARKLKRVLLGSAKVKSEVVSKANDQVVWTFDIHPRKANAVIKRVTAFKYITSEVLNSKMFKKGVKLIDKVNKDETKPEDYEAVKRMLLNTNIEIGH